MHSCEQGHAQQGIRQEVTNGGIGFPRRTVSAQGLFLLSHAMATASPQAACIKSNLACPQFSCLRPHGLDQSVQVPSSARSSRDVISIAGTGKISSFMPSMDSMTNQAIFEAGVCSQGFPQFAFGSHRNLDDTVSSRSEEAKNGNVSTSGEDFNEFYGPGLNSVVPGVLAKGFDRIFDDMGLRMSIEVIHSIDEVKNLVPTDSFVCLLEQCMRERDLAAGRKVHCLIVRSGLEADALMGSHLIRMFAFFEHLLEANQVLRKLFQPNAFSWSTIIMAHTKVGENEQALKLYHQMQLWDVEPDGHVFVAVLKACTGIMASKEGMWVHGHIIIHGLESDMFVASTLVDMYAKCDSLDHLQNVFDRLPERNVLVWNVLILSYAKHNHTQKAFQLFSEMQSGGMEPDHLTYVCMLKTCSRVGALEQGRQIFSYIVGSGLESDIFVGSTMIDMYAKCGCPEDGHILFDRLPNRDVVTWNSLMSGYLQHGSCLEVLQIFDRLQNECMKPNSVTFVFILKACSSLAALEQGVLIHAQVIESGFESDFCVGNTLVDMYAKCGSFEDAHVVFDRLPKLDIISWSVLIAGYTDSGNGEKALQVFVQLQQNSIEPDVSILISILKACANLETVEQGKLIHTNILKVGLESEVSVCNALIDMYAKSGSVKDAHRVFEGLPERDVVTWTALIGGYAQHDQGQEALQIYKKMQEEGTKPDSTTFVCVLKACPSAAASIEQGRQVHADIIENGLESNVYVSSTLVDMYTKCGSLENAGSVLNRLPKGNTVTWNAYLAGCSLQGKGEEALDLFQKMQQEGLKPSSITFISVLKACAGILTLEQGRQIHACVIHNGFGSDEYVGSTLIDMYFECGCVDSARIVFDGFSTKNVVAWNTMFGGYAKHDHGQLALQLLQQMLLEGMDPDQVTFICILKACANMAALEQGRQIHCHIISRGFELDVVVSCALLTMYAKCGSLEDGSMLFNRLPRHNVATWNMMIGGYTQHISSSLALQYYDDLQKVGLKPDYVTFIHLIVACNRMGLPDTACLHFKKMRDEHGITPRLEHHNAMVDLLGHAGCLDQAQDSLETIPFENNLIGWTSLLNSCRMHGNADLGKQCFDRVMALDDCNAAGYALMSKLYEHAGMWDNAERVEQLRKNINGWKKPAKAFIEVDKKVHQFIVGDKTHPKSGDIYAKLNALSVQSREKGYKPQSDTAYVDKTHPKSGDIYAKLNALSVQSREKGYKPQSDRAYVDKEDATCGHCERLAIAFGLTCTAQGTTIRVAKNLRMCADCHVATKTISRIEMREIFVIDASRLHHFKDGECSCTDCF